MSLQVWLPLIKDCENQGLSNLKFTPISANTSQQSNGKIGTTCYFNNTHTSGGLISDEKINLGTKLSMFCWFKFTSLMAEAGLGGAMGGQHRYLTSTGMGLTMKYVSASTGYLSVNTGTGGGDSNRTYNTYCGNTLLQANTWYHVGFTYDGNTIKFYLNGNLDGAHSFTGQVNVADYVHVFTWSSNDSAYGRTVHPNYQLYGYMNDFRIYDHVLSKKEVKTIAQGLVAHYQLKGMGRTNYLKGSGQFTEQNPLIRNANDVSHMNDSYVYHNGVLSATITAGGTYTLSVKCDGNPTGHPTSGTTASQRLCSLWLQHTGTGTHYHFGLSSGADGRLYGTVSLPTGTYNMRTNLYAADNVNYTVKFWDMKLVFGEYEPNDPWCPHEEDELYTAMRVDSSLWTDCSGYGNTLTQVGTIPVCGNSIRYGNCIDFNQTGYLKKDDFNIVTDKFTISFWVNTPPATNAQHFLFGTHNNWTGNGFSAWREANSASYNTIVKSNSASSHAGISFFHDADTWNHIAYVYTGTEFIYYKNGAEQSRITYGSGGTVSHPVLYLGNSLYSNAPNSEIDEASMSDFRFYVSALSDSDIADLYKNSASLSKDGTLFAYEFNENKQNTINKDGIVSTGGFNDKAVPTYDMKIKALDDGSTWARIHHLDVSGDKTCFANASEVAKCVNKNNRYSRMGIVDRYKAGGEYEFMLTYPSIKKSVPAGYTELEYIQATGSQYIRTGVYGYADGSYVRGHRWELDMEFTRSDVRQLMGYGPHGGEYWGVAASGVYEGMSVVAGKRDTIVHDYSGGTAGGNTLWVQNASRDVGSNMATSYEYTLFNLKWGGDTGYWCYAKLYRCKCIQGTTLIRDFVPAMRNSDGVIGLFDVVNNVFYTNAGGGSFLCNYSYLNYIESTGVQYINTGIAENAVYGIEMKCLVTGLAVNWQSLLSGTLDNFTIGSVDANKNAFYLRLRTTEVCRPSEMYSDKINTISIKNGLVHLNGSLVGTYTHGALSTATGALYVFANNAPSRYSKMRLYGLKIYDANGNVSRDFIPCKYGNSIGLFDNVTQAFYGNSGTGAFMYGGSRNNGYQWLDYIQNTGVEYINTGYPAPEGFISEAVVEYTSITGGGYVLGSHNISAPYGRNGYGLNGSGYFEIGTGDTCPGSSFLASANTRYTIKASTVKGDSYMDVNGSRAITTTDSTSRCADNVYVFSDQYSQYHNSNCAPFRLYSLKFWLPNGTLIRDFVPCISPSGRVGLYDKVTKRFYGNSGKGNLIAGPTEESIPLYNRWTQTSLTSDVNQGDNISFKPIFSSWPQHLGPLKPAQVVDTAYDCDVKGTGNWFAPIGQYKIWGDGIPAADGSVQTQTELWVRTDRFADEDQMKIYNGSIIAKDYIEI